MGHQFRLYIIIWATLLVWQASSPKAWAQSEVESELDRLGQFEITVNTKPPKNISIEDLTLDPDQDKKLNVPTADSKKKRFLYRLRHEGYMAFEEEQWVGRIQFKMFNRPATQSRQYAELAQLLTDVNQGIKEFKETLHDYQQYGIRLIDFCNYPLFRSIDGLEASLRVELDTYKQLLDMRQRIANDLMELTGEVGCKEVAEDYRKKLKDLRGNLNRILSQTQPLGQRYQGLKKELPHGSRKENRPSSTKSQPEPSPAAR